MTHQQRSLLSSLILIVAACSLTPAKANLLSSLVTERHWIGYTPRNFNPNIGQEPSEAQMRADLQQLYDDGWRKLYNYTLDGNLKHIPRIAKEVGFDTVLAGIFYFDAAQLEREKTNAQTELPHIDGFIVGNEGLAFGRYNPAQLLSAVSFFEGLGKPVTTTEVGGLYFSSPALLDVGDFATINIQPWFNGSLNPSDPLGMAQAVRDEYVGIKALRPDTLVVIKEAWWPTGGHPGATEANQIAFFAHLSQMTDANGDPLLFMWGESYDQLWKSEPSPFGTLGPDWGLYEENGAEKLIVDGLNGVYTAQYPVNFLPGDYDRNGVVNSLDYDEWSTSFGSTLGIPGSGADGNFDGVIDSADYNVWRDNLGASSSGSSTAVPEPTGATLCALLLLVHTVSNRKLHSAA